MQPNAQHSPSFSGAWRFLVPFFVISAIFLFFPCDLSIVSLVADAPGEIRDVSMVTLHPSTVTSVHLLQVCSQTLMWKESQSAVGVTLLSPPKSRGQKPTQKFPGWKYQPITKAEVCYSSYSLWMEVFLKEWVPYPLWSSLELWPQYLYAERIWAWSTKYVWDQEFNLLVVSLWSFSLFGLSFTPPAATEPIWWLELTSAPSTMWRTWNNKKILRHYSQSDEINISASDAETFSGKGFWGLEDSFLIQIRKRRRWKWLKDTQMGNREIDGKHSFPPNLHWGFGFSIVAFTDLCITYLHGKVRDEGCSWDLHLKHCLPCLGAAVHHGAGHGGESVAGNDRGPHVELRHPRPGFLWESKKKKHL